MGREAGGEPGRRPEDRDVEQRRQLKGHSAPASPREANRI